MTGKVSQCDLLLKCDIVEVGKRRVDGGAVHPGFVVYLVLAAVGWGVMRGSMMESLKH